MCDAELGWQVSHALATPRSVDNSFLLHDVLELLARLALLPLVEAEQREVARLRLVSLAAIHQTSGDPVPVPPGPDFDSVDDAFERFLAAVAAGEADDADQAMVHLVENMAPTALCRRLAPPTTTMMTAAGHAPILLANWPTVIETMPLEGQMVRGIARRLCEYAGLQADLPAPNHSRVPGSLTDLDAALRNVEILGSPGWGIFSNFHQAEESGLIATLPAVAAELVDDGFRVACRVSAASMLLDDQAHAPYGWSHALSLPTGLWLAHRHHADPMTALDIALTHVAGIRSAHGAAPIGDYAPDDPGISLEEALSASPEVAGAAVFNSPVADDEIVTALVSGACVQHDAHLVKYVHACTQCASRDPGHERLYYAAAAYLVALWNQNPATDDPLR